MTLSDQRKALILTSSNLAILALCAAGVAKDWSQSAFQLFLNSKLPQVWPFLLLYPAFLVIMPLLPRPKKVEIKTANKPSTTKARLMALVTSVIDYLVVGALLLFWDSIGRLEDGSLCPFTAAGTLLVGLVVMYVKDEIQCRFLWRKFISPYKINSWPYCWSKSFDLIYTSASFVFLNGLGLFLSGWVSCESVKNPKVLLQVLLESTLVSDVFTHIFMIFGHKWLHEKAYFLHKKHHKANKCLMSIDAPHFDLFDVLIEFGGGFPLLIIFKSLCFGPNSKVHFLTYGMTMLKGNQGHSGNPYAQFFFVPVLDYLIRTPLCHNLHHVIQSDYYSINPHSHFTFNAEARRKDIDVYNKHLKTQFPRNV